ncbi:MAG: hypothetical protein RSE34_00695 [Brevundimonas sp.]
MLHKAEGGTIREGDIVAGMSWGNDGIALAQWFIERGLAWIWPRLVRAAIEKAAGV